MQQTVPHDFCKSKYFYINIWDYLKEWWHQVNEDYWITKMSGNNIHNIYPEKNDAARIILQILLFFIKLFKKETQFKTIAISSCL